MLSVIKRSPLTAAVTHAIGTPMVVGLAYHGTTRERLTGLDNVWGKHIDAELFEQHLRFVTRHFRVLPVSEIAQRLRARKPLPRKCCFLTFDDGYAGNYDVAFPLLKKYGCVASFYIATSFVPPLAPPHVVGGGRSDYPPLLVGGLRGEKRYPLDVIDAALKYGTPPLIPPQSGGKQEARSSPQLVGGSRGEDHAIQIRGYFKSLDEKAQVSFLEGFLSGGGFKSIDDVPELGPHTRFMSWEQMREMQSAGMEFGSHTHSHQILARVSELTAREELRISKQLLEQNLGRECEQFCYPNGHYPEDGNEATNSLVREAGYQCAIYMSGKVNTKHTSPFMISRNAVGMHTPLEELARILAIAGPRVRNWLGKK